MTILPPPEWQVKPYRVKEDCQVRQDVIETALGWEVKMFDLKKDQIVRKCGEHDYLVEAPFHRTLILKIPDDKVERVKPPEELQA